MDGIDAQSTLLTHTHAHTVKNIYTLYNCDIYNLKAGDYIVVDVGLF